jgi:flagella basal body P-ring formation protein FlgA
LCAFLALPGIAFSSTVELLPTATVDGPSIRLGQVARVEAPDEARAAALRALDLGPAPRVGLERHVRRADIQRALRAHGWDGPDALVYGGVQTVTVYRASRETPADGLVQCARDALGAVLESRYRNVRLAPVDAPVTIVVPAAHIDYRARSQVLAQPLPRRIAQWVDVYADGRLYRSVPMIFEVSAETQALVANHDLAANVPLGSDTATLRMVDAVEAKSPLVTADAFDAGLRARRPIAAGAPLSWRDVSLLPAVERGASVTLRVSAGAVQIEQRGYALDDGKLGAMVRVKLASGAALSARVIGSALVEVGGS